MRPTLTFIQQKFDEYNSLCFTAKLPPINIVLSNARTYLGMCSFKTKRDLLMRKQHYDFRLRISQRYDLPQEIIEDTILHEMIHYYIAYFHIKDSSTHGKVFRQMMHQINTTYNRHISISHRLTDEQRSQDVEQRHTTHIVAVIRFHDNRVGIKCLPKSPERISGYCRQVKQVPEVASVVCYVTDNPFFNRYPTSAALKVYFIDELTLTTQLDGATRL